MRITIKTCTLLINLLMSSNVLQPVFATPKQPILIDYQVSGSEQVPYFAPDIVMLQVGKPYLFVIHNPTRYPINFVYGALGQQLFTHYLQGVPGLSQNSMALPAKSKVTWVFEMNQPGEFNVYAMNMGLGQKGTPSKIIVHPANYSESEADHQSSALASKLAQAQLEISENQPKNSTNPEIKQKPSFYGGRRG